MKIASEENESSGVPGRRRSTTDGPVLDLTPLELLQLMARSASCFRPHAYGR